MRKRAITEPGREGSLEPIRDPSSSVNERRSVRELHEFMRECDHDPPPRLAQCVQQEGVKLAIRDQVEAHIDLHLLVNLGANALVCLRSFRCPLDSMATLPR